MRIYKGVLVLNTSLGTGRFDAKSYGWFICCPKRFEHVLLEHEVQHAQDFKKEPFAYAWGYHFKWEYRLYAELRAYDKSHRGMFDIIAGTLNSSYDLPHKFGAKDVQELMPFAVENRFKTFKHVLWRFIK